MYVTEFDRRKREKWKNLPSFRLAAQTRWWRMAKKPVDGWVKENQPILRYEKTDLSTKPISNIC